MPKVKLLVQYDENDPREYNAALGFRFDVDTPAESVKRMFGALANSGFDAIAIELQDRPGYEAYLGATKLEV